MFTHEALGNSYELVETSPGVGSSLEVLEERGKPVYPEKNLSEQGRESATNSTHIWRQLSGFEPRPDWWEGECSHHRAISYLAPQTYFLDPWGFHRNFFHKRKPSKYPEKEKKNEES